MMVVAPTPNSASSDESYMAGSELSISCRDLYLNRQKTTKSFKEKLLRTQQKGKTTLDRAMRKLNEEMAGLMDQDLSFMEQLLTMNEKIEELKFQTYHAVKEEFDSSTSLADLSKSGDGPTMEHSPKHADQCECSDMEECCVVETPSIKIPGSKFVHLPHYDSVDSGYEDNTDVSDDCCSDIESD